VYEKKDETSDLRIYLAAAVGHGLFYLLHQAVAKLVDGCV
jgi:hypothetical protein